MAPDKQEKKRKQAPAVAASSEAPSKRLKKQKVTKDAAFEAKDVSKTPSNAINNHTSSAITAVNDSATKAKKNRKRAADFLSDNEDNAEPQKSFVKPDKKVKKVKSDKSETGKATFQEAIVSQFNTNEKPQKAKLPKVSSSDVPAKGVKKLKKTEWPTEAMTQVVTKALSNGDALTPKATNGMLGHSKEEAVEEDVDATTSNKASFSGSQDWTGAVQNKVTDEVVTGDESDDQGAALLAGFDSDGDDSAEDDGLDPANMTDLNLNKQQRKKLRQATRKDSKEGTGVVYVGRIPRGFYEAQMRQYFSQFGTITNLRLSRNKTTGASKHFAFIEFESNEVAKIVAQTMDNYLMFGHILKCKYAPSESLHPDTWKGANKRFKIVPYNKIEKRLLEEPKTKDHWEGKIAREQSKREKRLSKAQSMGYDYELPQLQGVDAILERKKLSQEVEAKAIKSAAEVVEPTGAVEPPNGVPLDVVALKGKQRKRSKAKDGPTTEEVNVKTPVNEEAKAKKTKKAEAITETRPPATVIDAPAAIASIVDKAIGKKSKKLKKTEVGFDAILPTTSVQAEVVAPPAKFAFHPDEIAELTGRKDIKKPKKAEKGKKNKAADSAAAQMQLNAELNDTVEMVKDPVEDAIDIAASAAVLPTPGGGKKIKKAKKEKA